MKETDNVIKSYIEETKFLIQSLRENQTEYFQTLKFISMTKENSRLLGFTPVYYLYKAVEDIYKALCDNKLVYSKNLSLLLKIVADKMEECCQIIETKPADINEVDVKQYLLYCDKAVAGEIFDPNHIIKNPDAEKWLLQKSKALKATKHKPKKKTASILSISSEKIAEIINLQEEMIARTYIINNQVSMLKAAIADKDLHTANETYKLLANDTQNLQNSLLIAHENLLSLIKDDNFQKNHQEYSGFFVTANGAKYLIPSEYIHDVICESPLNYETVQNQKIVRYVIESESGEEEDSVTEDIPVYNLSSLFPGQKATKMNILDTILIVDYQSQRIGIIVENVQKFVSVIKKNLPSSFERFKAVEGIAFDEKYDMIPILHIPAIMKMFRSLRGYDVKKFEAITKKHINKILVVDDSETTRQIERTILLTNNFLVEEAADGIEAMEKLKKKQFDLILCDDEMPRMNGDILLDNIRRMENYKSVPVVALADRPLGKADAFVSKSDFSRDQLIQTLKRMLDNE